MRHLLGWLAMFVPLWWLWLLLAGEWNESEWVAATAAAAVAAAIGELARSRAQVDSGFALRRLSELPLAALLVFADFGILVAALVRRRRGTFVIRKVRRADTPGERVWTSVVATFSPNAYVVDMTAERVLLHRVVPWRRSEEPA